MPAATPAPAPAFPAFASLAEALEYHAIKALATLSELMSERRGGDDQSPSRALRAATTIINAATRVLRAPKSSPRPHRAAALPQSSSDGQPDTLPDPTPDQLVHPSSQPDSTAPPTPTSPPINPAIARALTSSLIVAGAPSPAIRRNAADTQSGLPSVVRSRPRDPPTHPPPSPPPVS